jgi:hypothetical protein
MGFERFSFDKLHLVFEHGFGRLVLGEVNAEAEYVLVVCGADVFSQFLWRYNVSKASLPIDRRHLAFVVSYCCFFIVLHNLS